MKTGIFCNYENFHQDACRAISEQVQLVQFAEYLGFEEAWVTEHHFNQNSVSPSILVLMAHLAGVTSTIQLGSAALLLAFHNPITIAEEIATVDNLCKGRLSLGVAKGGLFPEQNKHFATAMSDARTKTLEAMTLIRKLLYEENVTFSGKYYDCDAVTIYPKPLQNTIPVYLATSDNDAIEYAAERSYGLMGGPPFSLEILKKNIAHYRSFNSSGSENLMLARFFFVAESYNEAVSEALPFLHKFSLRMKSLATQMQNEQMQNGQMLNDQLLNEKTSKHLQVSNNGQSCFDEDYLIENSIIGDVETCRKKIKKFQDELNIGTLVLKPASFDFQKNLQSLKLYTQEVRPYL
jgi:alkanesulfonate monooxygenase SsuD/methylene tetrahydromethanopterin reductase-like flavin-dependent oxidoreductase (luciferase family)